MLYPLGNVSIKLAIPAFSAAFFTSSREAPSLAMAILLKIVSNIPKTVQSVLIHIETTDLLILYLAIVVKVWTKKPCSS